MTINSINYGSSLLGQSVRNITNQLSDLSTQLSTGLKSTNYAGMGTSEGFAIAARSQLANISAFGDTMTNVNTISTPAVASADDILNGTGTKAGLKQVIAERQQADLGTTGLGRLVISAPTTTSVQVG